MAEKDSKETARVTIARGLAAVVRRDLHPFVGDAGMDALRQLLDDKRTAVCGPAQIQALARANAGLGQDAGYEQERP